MFCGNCGAQVPDDANVCPDCGTPLKKEESVGSVNMTEESSQEAAPTPVPAAGEAVNSQAADGQAKLIANILRVAAVVIALIAVILIVRAVAVKPYKRVTKQYIAAVEKQNGKKMLKLFPKAYVDSMIDQFGAEDKKELIDELEDSMESSHERLEDKYGKNYKIKIERYKDVEKMDKDELDELNDDLDDSDIKCKVKKAYKVEIKVRIKGKEDEDSDTITLTVGKVKGKWYIVDFGAAILGGLL